jgi:hypothetical protein
MIKKAGVTGTTSAGVSEICESQRLSALETLLDIEIIVGGIFNFHFFSYS